MAPVVLAATAATTALAASLGGAPSGWTSYVLQPGDTVSDLAVRHQTTTRALVTVNRLPAGGHAVRAGTRILLPGSKAASRSVRAATDRVTTYRVRAGDTVIGIAARLGTSPATILKLNSLDRRGLIYAGQHLKVPASAARAAVRQTGASSRPAGKVVTYKVRPGDTVSHVAVRLGSTSAGIIKLNRLGVSARVTPGQVLRVPVRATRSAAPRQDSATTFAGRTYPSATLEAAARNRRHLAQRAVPSRDAMRRIIATTARRHGVDPSLALAVSFQESGFNQRRVSIANAIGAMQVIPASGEWASQLGGRRLDLLDAQDNATAGVLILKALLVSSPDTERAVAGYYQGMTSVRRNGMYADTKVYVTNVLALRSRFR